MFLRGDYKQLLNLNRLLESLLFNCSPARTLYNQLHASVNNISIIKSWNPNLIMFALKSQDEVKELLRVYILKSDYCSHDTFAVCQDNPNLFSPCLHVILVRCHLLHFIKRKVAHRHRGILSGL